MSKTNGFRFSDCIWQIPALTYLHAVDAPSILTAVRIISISYILPFVLGPLLSFVYLRSLRKSEFIVFQLMYLATGGLSSALFTVGIINGGLFFFWPLFYMILLHKDWSRRHIFAAFLLLTGMAFSHESILFPCAVMLGAAGMRIKQSQSPVLKALGVFIAICLFFQFYRAYIFSLNSEAGNSQGFLNELLNFSGAFGVHYKVLSIVLVAAFAVPLVLPERLLPKLQVLGPLIAVAGLFGWLMGSYEAAVFEPRFYRSLAAPAAAATAFLAFYFHVYQTEETRNKRLLYAMLGLAVALFSSHHFLYRHRANWHEYRRYIEASVSAAPSGACITNNYSRPSLTGTYLSIFLQDRAAPDKVLIEQPYRCADGRVLQQNRCDALLQQRGSEESCFVEEIFLNGQRFNFKNMKSIFESTLLPKD